MTCAVKIELEFFVFQAEVYQFSLFHESEAKLDKDDLKKGLTRTFKVKKL